MPLGLTDKVQAPASLEGAIGGSGSGSTTTVSGELSTSVLSPPSPLLVLLLLLLLLSHAQVDRHSKHQAKVRHIMNVLFIISSHLMVKFFISQ